MENIINESDHRLTIADITACESERLVVDKQGEICFTPDFGIIDAADDISTFKKFVGEIRFNKSCNSCNGHCSDKV